MKLYQSTGFPCPTVKQKDMKGSATGLTGTQVGDMYHSPYDVSTLVTVLFGGTGEGRLLGLQVVAQLYQHPSGDYLCCLLYLLEWHMEVRLGSMRLTKGLRQTFMVLQL